MFFKGEMRELPDGAGGAFDAIVGKGGECFPVHHQRGDMRKERAQSGEDQEALRIQVAPVVDGALGQPGDPNQVVNHEAGAEKREGLPLGRQREEGHLVLGDDAALPTQQLKNRELRGRDAEFIDRQLCYPG